MERVLIENFKNNKNLFLIQLQKSKGGLFNSKWVLEEGKIYLIDDLSLLGYFISRWIIKNIALKIINNSSIKNTDLSDCIKTEKCKRQLSDVECFNL